MNTIAKKYYCGFSLVEMMITILVTSVMAASVLKFTASQTQSVRTESHRQFAAQEAQAAFDTVVSLLRQSYAGSIVISQSPSLNPETTPELADDVMDITFRIPAGYPIWPNNTGQFNANEVRFFWHNGASNLAPKDTISIANGIEGNANTVPLHPVSGGDTTGASRIVNLDIWPLAADGSPLPNPNSTAVGGYLVRVTASTAVEDFGYTNPQDANGDLTNFRTFTVAGVVTPRN
jgi:prepilin-type N-terminal cleavage/methylation domain-containing protein